MPIYEYVCQSCEHELEAIQKISAPPLEECPSCGEASLKKKISAPSFRLKGSGWYETDFKKDKQRNLAKNDGPSSETKNDNGKSETKASDAKSDKSATTETKKADSSATAA